MDPDGRQSLPYFTLEDMCQIVLDNSPLFCTIISALSGNQQSQYILQYTFHQVGRDMLQDISDISGTAALAFLAVGLPQASGVVGTVNIVAEGILAFDDLRQGNTSEFLERGGILVAGILAGKATKHGVSKIANSIQVTVGKNSRFYEIGRRGALKTSDALKKQLTKDIADGYFGEKIAPAVSSEIITQTLEAFNALED